MRTGSLFRESSAVQIGLLAVAAWFVWRPTETHAWSAVVLAALVLALVAWGWRRTRASGRFGFAAAGAVFALLALAGVCGWDPATAVTELGLAAGVGVLIWLASREAVPEILPAILGLVISGLAIWGLWQVTTGFEQAAVALAELPEPIRASAAERLASGRAFASLSLPSHLAILFATALPLLVARVRLRWPAVGWILGSCFCVVGLALTRSPVGVGLALIGCGALALQRRGLVVAAVALGLALVLAVVVLWRGDVLELEPVSLRVDNWRTAVWVWSTAPAAGVGPGGFGQASQAVPFEVGNRPRHAHSLPLEWLAEIGPAGLALFTMAVFGLWRLVRGLWPLRPELAVSVVMIPLHNFVDFSLYGSGVAIPWAVLVGWALACRAHQRPAAADDAPQAAVEDRELWAVPIGRTALVVAAALALAGTVLHATSRTVAQAAELQASPQERMEGARHARHLAPWRVDELGLMAISALDFGDAGRIAQAVGEIDGAVWLRPHSAALAALRARLQVALGAGPSGAAEAWRARHEQPANQAYAAFFDGIVRRLEDGKRRETR